MGCKISSECADNAFRNWLYVLLDPLGILEIVMVGNFNQHRWGVGLQYLGQSVGRTGVDSLRIWINFFELLCNDICKTLAQNSVLTAAGTIVNIATCKSPAISSGDALEWMATCMP